MAYNTFGSNFSITTFGESHGPAIGVVVDGCPAGLKLDEENIKLQLKRRQTGQSKFATQRKEPDTYEILSGVFEGVTTGHPICFLVRNKDQKSKDYSDIQNKFRPGHADFTYQAKYGVRDYKGGGRSSARETVGRVIGGAIAAQLLATVGVSFRSGVTSIGTVEAEEFDWSQVEDNEFRFLDPKKLEEVLTYADSVRNSRDSVGGVLEVQALGVPVGLGEPLFGKLDAAIASSLMSVPAVKGVELGTGFRSATMRGSEMNDEMSEAGFKSNNHGGVLGGISSGNPIVARVAIKPTSSIPTDKQSLDTDMKETVIQTKGRHDICIAIRAAVILESMLALTLMDFWLQHEGALGVRKNFSDVTQVKYGPE